MDKKRRLTVKQQKFADYYIELGNATEAAIKAGYSKKTATVIGAENLTKPYVKAYIEKRMEELKSERVADQQEILEYLTSVMRGEATGTELVGKGKGYQEVQQEPPSIAEKTKAAELLGKRYMMFTDRQQVNVTGAVQFIDDISDADED